ncbi:MAG: peptide chain release factor N(5)-glutamine methyltransferase [Candidatus Nanopelagicaceae bacterium]|nr:peptide chain release factor N(5)-glutamine methyltransferase [Candidatus Nanopelagicaceae bacterium]
MSIKQVLKDNKAQLASAGISEVDAELILAFVLGVERMELHARDFELNLEQIELLDELIAKRISGKPTQYLIGHAPFRYLTFQVGRGVLIPRPESEALVDAALLEIEKIITAQSQSNKAPVSIVDLGSGSGALAISIAYEAEKKNWPVTVIAVEKSDQAIEWLKRNIAACDVSVRLVSGDVLEVLEGVKCDIVIANPPYVPEGDNLPELVIANEPKEALFGGGDDGLEIPRRFIQAASSLLKPGGLLIMEHHESQPLLLEAELSRGYSEINQNRDLNNRPRWISARREAE